jgi:hypothetical protein
MQEQEIYGWIETSVDDDLTGWIWLPERLKFKAKYIDILIAGKEAYSIKLITKENVRPDLYAVKGALNFSATFDSVRLRAEIATANITFSLRVASSLGTLKVVPDLVESCAGATRLIAKGLSFGRLSSDSIAMVGAGGNLFLVSGSNNLEELYKDPSMIDAQGWVEVFLSRYEASQILGYKYIQIMLAEKSSILHWKVPYPAERGSSGYRFLMDAARQTTTLSSSIFDGLIAMPDEVNSESLFRAYDTHMSTSGAQLMFDKFVNAFFSEEDIRYSTLGISHTNVPGDLGSRFAEDGNVLERPPVYLDLANSKGEICEISLVECFDPDEGNTGTYRHWKCSNAPIKQKVLCFGGSSFERGTDSMSLSWWFSRMFSEFHFFWSDEADYELIKRCQPNAVIFQTVERFLTLVPDQ